MKIQKPQEHFCTAAKELPETHLSLGYIRQIALQALGNPHTEEVHISQHTTMYHTTTPGIQFNMGDTRAQKDKWCTGAACNSETSAKALGNYFLHLRDACGIKRGKKNFKWDTQELRFVEVN